MKSDDTKARIQKSATKLFAKYGYAATSTRMIASLAGANVSAISLYFGGKQQLFSECMKRCLGYIEGYYKDSFEKVNEAMKEGGLTPDFAYDMIVEMIDKQLEVAFNDKYRVTRELIYSENNDMEDADSNYLSSQIFDKNERLMAMLMTRIAPIEQDDAIVYSRYINGAIISFGEHAGLYKRHIHLEKKDPVPDWVREDTRKCCLAVLDSIVNGNSTVK